MIAVLDTSAAVEVVLKRESATLFSHFLAEADLVMAPNILIAEATNVRPARLIFHYIPSLLPQEI